VTPVARFIKKAAEKIASRYYEGPQPPERLLAQVGEFANLNPRATRAEWAEFARKLAAAAYRDGYQRGYEWVERDEEPTYKRLPPELIAEQDDPDWQWSPPLGPDLSLPDERPEEFEPGELAPARHPIVEDD
jgi:hypothetical protein